MLAKDSIRAGRVGFACLALIFLFLALSLVPAERAHAAYSYSGSLADCASSEYKQSLRSTPYRQEGGARYWSADGAFAREAWCADFVSYCAEKSGLMRSGKYPKRSRTTENNTYAVTCNCGSVMRWMLAHGGIRYENDGTYIPRKGDLVFRWDKTYWGHIGIVSANGGTSKFYVVEGNYQNRLNKQNYAYSDGSKWTCFVHWDGSAGIDITNAATSITKREYNARAQTPPLSLYVGGRRVPANVYKTTYSGNVDCGYAKAVAKANKPNSGTKAATFQIYGGRQLYSLTKYLSYSYTYKGKRYKVSKEPHRVMTTDEARKDELLRRGYAITGGCAMPSTGDPVVEFHNKTRQAYLYVRANDRANYSKLTSSAARNCGWVSNGVQFYSNTRHNRWWSVGCYKTLHEPHWTSMSLGGAATNDKPNNWKYKYVQFYCC